ncbi:uncharacterized protein LOC143609877 [Bidens hawaiensis]|uniref:uncharacterized protein LOC143609877 n=1 Tax=Bidens hawaiensis TaxID=980011 RepID=UPI00404B4552
MDKVNVKKCAFFSHLKTSQHINCLVFAENFLNQEAYIETRLLKQTQEEIVKYRLRLIATVDVVRWLRFQACALRGHDESSKSKNRGNLIELLKLLASYNDEIAKVILEDAPYNSKYTSSDIQKEILSIIANIVRKNTSSEVEDSFFCLDVKRLCGQGFDGASNMRGEWNGLETLVHYVCPYAYYVYCFAHRLQLSLVYASREVIPIHKFFNKLVFTINVVCASNKCYDELQKAKTKEIKKLLEMGEIKSRSGLNQVGTLRSANDTRWGSHFNSVCSLIDMFGATRAVLQRIIEDLSHTTFSQCRATDTACDYLKSFDFVFTSHDEGSIGKTETLSQALQKKSQDILNATELVSSTKANLNEFRNNGWEYFLAIVTFFW